MGGGAVPLLKQIHAYIKNKYIHIRIYIHTQEIQFNMLPIINIKSLFIGLELTTCFGFDSHL